MGRIGDVGADLFRRSWGALWAATTVYVRLAVDRFVVNESAAPGTHLPDQTGQILGRYLIDLRNEDASDTENALEYAQ